jgi:hypothetical protein
VPIAPCAVRVDGRVEPLEQRGVGDLADLGRGPGGQRDGAQIGGGLGLGGHRLGQPGGSDAVEHRPLLVEAEAGRAERHDRGVAQVHALGPQTARLGRVAAGRLHELHRPGPVHAGQCPLRLTQERSGYFAVEQRNPCWYTDALRIPVIHSSPRTTHRGLTGSHVTGSSRIFWYTCPVGETDHLGQRALVRLAAQVVGAPSLADGAAVLEAVPPSVVPPLAALARRHGLEAWLSAVAPPTEAFEPIRAQRPGFLAAQARVRAVLVELSEVFTRLHCEWAVLKGPALAYTVYPRPDLRHAADLDVLVPPSRFGDVLAALEASPDFGLLDLNWPLTAAAVPGELRVQSRRGVLVDLHWSVLDGPGLRRRFRMPTADLLSRVRRLEPPGIPALSAVDQLVHLGVHGALSGANRLVWLLDAHLAARRDPDWDAVRATAEATGATASLAVVLARVRRLWDTPVSPRLLRQLAGGTMWRGLDRLVDVTGPVRGDPARSAAARAWARSARIPRRSTLTEFGRHGVAWVRAGTPRLWRAISFDPSDPASPLHRVDDPDARRRYLASVAAAE